MVINRKQFLRQVSGCCAAVATLQATEAAAPANPPSSDPGAKTEGTPINDRMAFAQRWAKRMLDNMDKVLDEPTRAKLMHANGRTCFDGTDDKPPQSGIDDFVAAVTKWHGGPENSPVRREGDIVYFNYVENPKNGVKVADGWCLCPLVEKGPPGLSGTYCECSVGYVTGLFERVAGNPVRVELLESLKRGGKGCRFKVHLT